MSEAKRKQRRKEAFLKQHPYCCYCGGTTPATTVDHVPSIQMFSLRRRPKGLEVPACEDCNQGTRQHEQAAAMLGRVYSDGPTEAERHETKRIMRAVNTNIPGLLEEMWPSPEQEARAAVTRPSLPGTAGALNCTGPLLNQSVQIFGAKLGFALHYSTTGRIIPQAGGVAVIWYSNYDAVTERIPAELLQILGDPQTLRQGRWNAGDQFSYCDAAAEGGKMVIYFSTFRKSFAVASLVNEDMSGFDGIKENARAVHRTGCFRKVSLQEPPAP